jgi:hypothetical protein
MNPRALAHSAVRQQRRAMLSQPHIAPLVGYVANLRSRGLGKVPDFDPHDGGVEARMLFLLEKPGPMTVESGFISRNNDDPTAEAILNFMQIAGIPRELTILWNVIPWWNGTRKVTAEELRQGIGCVTELISMLPKLSVVVLVGQKAGRARRYLESTGLHLTTSAHPSPIVRAALPKRWNAIPSEWAKARGFILERAERGNDIHADNKTANPL